MCLNQSFSHCKWILHAVLYLTISTNCVYGSSNFDTAFLPDFTKFCSIFLCHSIENLMRILLQVGFTSDFVTDCFFKLCF